MAQRRVFGLQFKNIANLRTFVLLCVSAGMSGALTRALLQRIAWSSDWYAAAIELVIALVLAGALFLALRRLVDEFIACDAALRRLVLALIVSGAIIAALFTSSYPSTLIWRWAAGPQSGDVAPVFSGTSWDGVARRVIDLHTTNNPETMPYGVWRAVADLSDVSTMAPGWLELWVTQPSWAVIDPATDAPYPTLDGVDLVIRVEKGGAALSEQRVLLDPPVTPEQRSWRHVVVDLPVGAERLSVEVAMRQTLDYDRVWITEATIRPFWDVGLGPIIPMLFVAFVASTLVFLRRMSLAVRGAQRLASFFADWGWLPVGVSCLWLAYMVVWQRGLYLDDWSIGLMARDRETLEWKQLTISRDAIPTFPARILTYIVTSRLVALMWTDEFIVRLLITCCVGINALLLGWLVYRMTHMRLSAIIAGWLFLVPTVYTDVTLWAGAVTYVFISGLTLIVLHIAWSVAARSVQFYPLVIAANILWLLNLFWAEATLGALALIPIIALMQVLQKPRAKLSGLIYRGGILTGSLLGTTGLFAFFVMSSSPLIERRGGLYSDLASITQRIDSWLRGIYWLTVSPEWGHRIAAESLFVGLEFVTKNRYGSFLLSVLIIAITIKIFYWKAEKPHNNLSSIFAISLFGLFWFIVTIYFPYFLAKNQIVERRFLYFSLAGMIVFLAAIASLARSDFLQRLTLTFFGFTVVVLSCCSIGQARVFEVQYKTDSRMFYSIREMTDPKKLPQKVLFVAVNLDFWIPGPESRMNGMIVSAFEASWSGREGLSVVYPHKEIEYIPFSRWDPTRFSEKATGITPRFRGCSELSSLFVNGCGVDLERTVFFSSRTGTPMLVKSIVLKRKDGTERVVVFPLVERIDPEGRNSLELVTVSSED